MNFVSVEAISLEEAFTKLDTPAIPGRWMAVDWTGGERGVYEFRFAFVPD